MTYLDHNATTPLAKGLSDFVRPYFEGEFGNPSSLSYDLGRRAKKVIETARLEVSRLIGAEPEEIVFTSGGTESINLAILGVASSMVAGDVVARSAVEHSAVKASMDFCHSAFKIREEIILVSGDGALKLSESPECLNARLCSVMLANNETGIIHDLKTLREKLLPYALLHVDATQGIGKIPFSFKELGIDLCSFSAHKFGGPKGVGALVIKNGTAWNSPMSGGGQEGGRRGGTENVALIAGLGYAANVSRIKLEQGYMEKVKELRDYFELHLLKLIPEVEIMGMNARRLPNTTNSIIPGIVGANLVKYLGDKDICISTGSACKANSFSPSPVLTAMGYSSLSSVSAIRVSFGDGNQRSDADILLEGIVEFRKVHNKIEDLIK